MKSLSIRILCLLALISTLLFSSGGAPVMAGYQEKDATPPELELSATSLKLEVPSEDEQIYIIKFRDAPLATYSGGILGLAATNTSATGNTRLDVHSPASQAYLTYLESRQETFLAQAESVMGRPVSYLHTYDYVFGGAALSLTAAEAGKLAKMDYVVSITPEFIRQIQTDAGPGWIGADSMWTNGYKGENLIVGVIDTGINPLNPSFADIGDDGYDHTNPRGSGNYVGVCDSTNLSYDATFRCNDKLIGAYDMVDGTNAVDVDGHGSHTASTAAGNVVNDAEITAPTITLTRDISGVAPHANLITYRACGIDGCPGAALIDAIDQAVADGVDAINYSIGSDTPTDPWTDADALAFLNARAAGVFVATSAGNAGPGFGTVGSPANAPWVTSVGNSTHNRQYVNSLINMTGGDTAPPADIQGKSLTAGYGPAPIVYAGDYGDPLCGTAFSAGTWNGEIVVCDRGDYGRVAKGENVLAGGAGGYILANDATSGNSLVADGHALPAVHITYNDGVALKTWMASGSGHIATVEGTTMVIDNTLGDVMAASSSRGVNQAVPGVIKPDVTAPGTDIFAAYGTGGDITWNMISGTSMASPHVAGAGILLMQAHPDWTPAQIQSALMLTGQNTMFKEDSATTADPFDMGGGRVQIGEATDVGFVLDETTTGYENAAPTLGGDPTALNIASLSNNSCAGACSWTREISSTAGIAVAWTASSADPVFTIEPASFTLLAEESQVITITADVSSLPADTWYFGSVDFSTVVPGVSNAHMSIAVLPTAGVIPAEARVLAGRDAGSRLVKNLELEAANLNSQAVGLEPTITETWLAEDPTNVWPTAPNGMYDDLDQVYHATFQVPAEAVYLAVELLESTSPDLDLAVGYDANGDGLPAESEELATSGSMGSLESVFFTGTELESAVGALNATAYANGGQYWVLVMNFEASVAGEADYVKIATAAVGATDTSVDVWMDTPSSASLGTPFDGRLYYDLPNFNAWYGVIDFYDNANYLTSMPVQIVRGEDDVIKDLINLERGASTITATFAITVAGNSSGENWSYLITDTLPTGMSFVPGSASGGAVINGNQLLWDVDAVGSRNYAMSTSLTDPLCAMPLAPAGHAYLDLEPYNYLASSALTGDANAWSVDVGAPIEYYGVDHSSTFGFTTDGFAYLDQATLVFPSHTTLPNAADPNDMMAMLWTDLEVVYNAATNAGITYQVGLVDSNNAPIAKLLEYDNVIKSGDPGSYLDFEMALYYQPNDAVGEYEIVYAYDNIVGAFTNTTIGVEDPTGTTAALYGYNDVVLQDDMAICFDWTYPQAQSITYQVTAATTQDFYTISMDNTVSDPGAELVTNNYVLQLVANEYPIINEFLSKGTEWVELYNPNSMGIDLTGYYLIDSPCGTVDPASTFGVSSISAHEYLLVNSGALGDNFDLGDTGDVLYLCTPDDQEADSVGYGIAGGAPLGHVAGSGITYSTARTPDGADTDDYAADWNLDVSPTPGTMNDAPAVALGSSLIINEISNNGVFELYNPTVLPINLGTYAVSKSDMGMVLLPSGVIGVKQTARVVLTHPTIEITENDVLYLFNSNQVRVDQLGFNGIDPSLSNSVQRIPDGRGPNDGYDWISSGGGVTLFDLPNTLGEYNMIATIESTVQTPAMPIPGDLVTYTITMENSFDEAISPISMEDALPTGLTFESWVTTPYTDTLVADNTISWTGDMAKTSAITWEFTARIGALNGPATISNPAKLIYYSYETTADADFMLAGSIWMPMLMKNSSTQ